MLYNLSGQAQCWIEFMEAWQWQLYMTIVAISLFILPTTIIATCYTIIIITIWKKSVLTIQTDNKLQIENKCGT